VNFHRFQVWLGSLRELISMSVLLYCVWTLVLLIRWINLAVHLLYDELLNSVYDSNSSVKIIILYKFKDKWLPKTKNNFNNPVVNKDNKNYLNNSPTYLKPVSKVSNKVLLQFTNNKCQSLEDLNLSNNPPLILPQSKQVMLQFKLLNLFNHKPLYNLKHSPQ